MASQNISNVITLTPTITAGAYSANDVVGGQQTFTSAVQAGHRTAVLQSLVLIDYAKQEAEMDLLLFDQQISTIADNAAEAITDADMANCIGIINIAATDYTTNANNSVATVNNIGLLLKGGIGVATTIYGYLVTRGTPTYGSTADLILKAAFLQD